VWFTIPDGYDCIEPIIYYSKLFTAFFSSGVCHIELSFNCVECGLLKTSEIVILEGTNLRQPRITTLVSRSCGSERNNSRPTRELDK
jgi:hypothetical protein